jgi:hypothetical protein
MKNFNAFGSPFSHLSGGNKGYSTHGKIPHYPWKWEYDGSALDSFYMEHTLNKVFEDNFSRKKYGMLVESSAIMPGPYLDLKENLERYTQVFDAIFTCDRSLIELHKKIYWIPANGSWIQDIKIHEKSKLISMIASDKAMCEGHLVRLKWVEKLKNNLDMFGRGINPIDSKEQGLNDYMFSVAIENNISDDYFTEKVLDCFNTGTIPVYLGTKNITKYFNEEGIIFLNDGFQIESITPEFYYSKMSAIIDNFNRVQKFHTIEDYIATNYPFVIEEI